MANNQARSPQGANMRGILLTIVCGAYAFRLDSHDCEYPCGDA